MTWLALGINYTCFGHACCIGYLSEHCVCTICVVHSFRTSSVLLMQLCVHFFVPCISVIPRNIIFLGFSTRNTALQRGNYHRKIKYSECCISLTINVINIKYCTSMMSWVGYALASSPGRQLKFRKKDGLVPIATMLVRMRWPLPEKHVIVYLACKPLTSYIGFLRRGQ